MYLRNSRWDIVYLYELQVNEFEMLHVANAPFYYALNNLAFGIVVDDPGGCHVTLELGSWQSACLICFL